MKSFLILCITMLSTGLACAGLDDRSRDSFLASQMGRDQTSTHPDKWDLLSSDNSKNAVTLRILEANEAQRSASKLNSGNAGNNNNKKASWSDLGGDLMATGAKAMVDAIGRAGAGLIIGWMQGPEKSIGSEFEQRKLQAFDNAMVMQKRFKELEQQYFACKVRMENNKFSSESGQNCNEIKEKFVDFGGKEAYIIVKNT